MSPRQHNRIVLIGCGKAKVDEEAPAADLYTGSLFRARREYAESSGSPWWIVSAHYGLLHPDTMVKPYDLRITDLPEVERAAWRLRTVAMLLDELPDDAVLHDVHVEIHAGRDYAEGLIDVLLAAGLSHSWPVEGLGVGEQLAFYKTAKGTRRAA